MMKKSLTVLALAGLATGAMGQDFSLSLIANASTIDTTGGAVTFTMTVIGDASVGTHMLGGAFSLESNGDCIANMQWNNASWSAFNTDGGFAGDGDYNEVIFGQLVIPGVPPFDVPAAGSDLGMAIGSFTVTMEAGVGDFPIEFNLVEASPFSLEVLDLGTGNTFNSSQGNLTLNGATLNVVPNPSTISVFGCLGLLATRRRR